MLTKRCIQQVLSPPSVHREKRSAFASDSEFHTFYGGKEKLHFSSGLPFFSLCMYRCRVVNGSLHKKYRDFHWKGKYFQKHLEVKLMWEA